MPRFEGDTHETLILNVPREQALAAFCNPKVIARYTGQMASYKILDDHTIHFHVQPQSSHGVVFQADYICRYDVDSQGVLTWRSTTANNISVAGEARFIAISITQTRLEYKQSLAMDMTVNRLLAALIAPLIKKGIRDGVLDYLKRMKQALESP